MSLVANQFSPNTEQLRDVLMSTALPYPIRYLVPSIGSNTNYYIEVNMIIPAASTDEIRLCRVFFLLRKRSKVVIN